MNKRRNNVEAWLHPHRNPHRRRDPRHPRRDHHSAVHGRRPGCRCLERPQPAADHAEPDRALSGPEQRCGARPTMVPVPAPGPSWSPENYIRSAPNWPNGFASVYERHRPATSRSPSITTVSDRSPDLDGDGAGDGGRRHGHRSLVNPATLYEPRGVPS